MFNEGNIYLTTRVVAVYNKEGKRIEEINIPERPANVTFGGKDGKTLFVTARTSLYATRMRVRGAERKQAGPESKFSAGRLTAEQDTIKTSAGDLTISLRICEKYMMSFSARSPKD